MRDPPNSRGRRSRSFVRNNLIGRPPSRERENSSQQLQAIEHRQRTSRWELHRSSAGTLAQVTPPSRQSRRRIASSREQSTCEHCLSTQRRAQAPLRRCQMRWVAHSAKAETKIQGRQDQGVAAQQGSEKLALLFVPGVSTPSFPLQTIGVRLEAPTMGQRRMNYCTESVGGCASQLDAVG